MNGECIARLTAVGFSYNDAAELRRISMTLHRWHELECGDGNEHGSWSIETIPVTKGRLRKQSSPACSPQYDMTIPANTECKRVGEHWAVADTSKVKGSNEHDLAHYYVWLQESDVVELPFMVHHHYLHGRGKDYVTRTKIADREKGAQKRLGALMARYPGFTAYVQGDPRGASLYILRPGDVPAGEQFDSYYSRGIAVYK